MRVLHTADWHIGQTFFEYDRSFEHQKFLQWLILAVVEQDIDVLLMSGDVFDVSNPSACSISLFYTFLKDVTRAHPHLQIVVIAGNHDSPSRLEAPTPLLEFFNIKIIGTLERDKDGNADYQKLVVPLKDRAGAVKAWCMGIPFLRNGDYPVVAGAIAPYADGVAALYKEVYDFVCLKKQKGHAVIAMGHLHTSGAEISEPDKSERLIMGGVELIGVSAFSADIAYTALGHIHKPQKIGGRENVRYSGSPLPMSFSEINYKHQVVVVELQGEIARNITAVPIPLTVNLIRIPAKPKPLIDALAELSRLPDTGEENKMELAPYLEVRVMLEGPEPSLRHKIEMAIANKFVRLARIDVRYPAATGQEAQSFSINELNDLAPGDVFKKIYKSKYNTEIPPELELLFNEVLTEVNGKE
jgi:exonuclease SbcD